MAVSILIVCEGDSDEAFFRQLIAVRGLSNLGVYQRRGGLGGKDAFEQHLRSIKTGTQYSGVKTAVIAVDCDDDPVASFANVANQIRAAEDYGVPTAPLVVTTPTGKAPAVVVLMVPWAGQCGAIEKLWLQAGYRRRKALATKVRGFVRAVQTRRWTETNLDKLGFRCLLSAAVPTEPYVGPQWAWDTSRGRPGDVVPVGDRCFNRIADWLAGL